jgi:hypothetical protein
MDPPAPADFLLTVPDVEDSGRESKLRQNKHTELETSIKMDVNM